LETLAASMPYTLQCGVASGSTSSRTRFSSLFWFFLACLNLFVLLFYWVYRESEPFRFVETVTITCRRLPWTVGPIRVGLRVNETAALTKSELARSSQEAHEKIRFFIGGGPRNYARQKKSKARGPHVNRLRTRLSLSTK
jgi:hypothetical protein